MRIPDDYVTWNVAAELKDPDSVLNFWRGMLTLRKSYEDELVRNRHRFLRMTLTIQVYGSFHLLCPENEVIFAYVRANSILVVLNFSDEVSRYPVPKHLSPGATLAYTQSGAAKMIESTVVLQPYSGVMYRLT
jgi:alpha-glucosidase